MSDEELCASWLWAHDRWRNQDIPSARLRLEAKRDLLAADLRARGLRRLPRGTRVWVRLPNWLGDVVMAVPLLRARPRVAPRRGDHPPGEAGVRPAAGVLRASPTGSVPLPRRGPGYFAHFAAAARARTRTSGSSSPTPLRGRPRGPGGRLPPALRDRQARQAPPAPHPRLPPAGRLRRGPPPPARALG